MNPDQRLKFIHQNDHHIDGTRRYRQEEPNLNCMGTPNDEWSTPLVTSF